MKLSKAETHFDGDLPFGADALRTRNGGVDDVEHAQGGLKYRAGRRIVR